MKFEVPPQIPEDNELPLNIENSDEFPFQGREAKIYKFDAAKGGVESGELLLKEVKREDFDSIEEAVQSKKFYDVLKNSPELSKFITNTLYFTARMKAGENPKSYRLQKRIDGKTIDFIPDKELYGDQKLNAELLELVNGLIVFFEKQKKKAATCPTFTAIKLFLTFFLTPDIPRILLSPKSRIKTGSKFSS